MSDKERDKEALSTEGEGEPGDGQSWQKEVSEPSIMSETATGDTPDPKKVADAEAEEQDKAEHRQDDEG